MKRKLLCGLLAALTLTCATVKAAPSRVVPVQVDGTVLSQGVNYLQSGVTYVPLRGLLDAFGGWSVWWDSSRKVAAAASGSQSVTANPSRNTVTVNGRTYSGKVFVERGRTYIPLRTLATALGGSVAWDRSWTRRPVNFSGRTKGRSGSRRGGLRQIIWWLSPMAAGPGPR